MGLVRHFQQALLGLRKKDVRGNSQFVDENMIKHVSSGDNITIVTGSPFDFKVNYTII
jgi:hypothetical protein